MKAGYTCSCLLGRIHTQFFVHTSGKAGNLSSKKTNKFILKSCVSLSNTSEHLTFLRGRVGVHAPPPFSQTLKFVWMHHWWPDWTLASRFCTGRSSADHSLGNNLALHQNTRQHHSQCDSVPLPFSLSASTSVSISRIHSFSVFVSSSEAFKQPADLPVFKNAKVHQIAVTCACDTIRTYCRVSKQHLLFF